MRYLIALAVAFATPAVAAGQAGAPPPATAPADPARLTAAQKTIDFIWPLGTFRRVMDSTFKSVMDTMMSGTFGLKLSDIAGEEAAKNGGDPDATLVEMAEKADPHFRERTRIAMDVMMKEMTAIMADAEPMVRRELAAAYARRFTAQELGDMNVFFATPSGSKYAREAVTIMTDPQLMQAMQSFTPKLLQSMPEMMKKVEAATAHLPPPPKRADEEDHWDEPDDPEEAAPPAG